ncbi:MAG: phosphodiester glycosidase family protein [Acidobacteria bacterium]|nr:phosphodiester glycosidase family protein [Acidobacteriota bacterium]
MKFPFVRSDALAAVLLAVLAGFATAQDFKEVHPGVEYAKLSRIVDGKNVNFNLLRLDLKKVRLDVVHAMDSAIGTEATSSLVRRHKAVAAVNAGFFRLDNSIFAGDAAGVLQIDGKLLSESSNDRTAIIIANGPKQTSVNFDSISVGPRLLGLSVPLNGVDRERKVDEMIVYTPHFAATTLTDSSGVEVVVRKGKVVKILDHAGSTKIPCDGYVLSATGSARTRLLVELEVGRRLALTTFFQNDRKGRQAKEASLAFANAEDVTNGVPRLIRNGKIDITWNEERASKSFVETRHPRTAVAILKDGKCLLLTADGRSETSGGIDLYDLADILLELGAVDAMNLDGGGSTTMVLDDKVVNQPSDKGGERKVGDALIVTLRK